MEALPPGPFLVSVNSYKNIDHCKSVSDCQIGNKLHTICKIFISGFYSNHSIQEIAFQYPHYLKCTLLPKQLEVSKRSFWHLKDSDLSRLLEIITPLFQDFTLQAAISFDPSKRGLLAAFPESSHFTDLRGWK